MSTDNQELQVSQPPTTKELTFGNSQEFEHAQRVAKMLSVSNLIPKEYQNNIPNTMIALEMANRIGASPLMVMQNLYIVQGKPSWSGSFVIAALNACGRFTPLRFHMEGTGESLTCYAYANDKKTGEKLKGTTITMAMVKGEGWGKKWQTMPEQMMQYRSGSFFGRTYAPDILMGMPTIEEVEDFTLLMSDEQEQYIESLMETSTYDEVKKRGVKWKMGNGISQRDALDIINDLKLNQVAPMDGKNPSTTDAKKAVAQTLL